MIRKDQGKVRNKSLAARKRRILNLRKKIEGAAERPRVCLVKSKKNLAVQVIDDSLSKTLIGIQTFGKNAPEGAKKSVEGAKILGQKTAEKMIAANLKDAVFDRRGFPYHGVVKAFVEGMRESGINI